MTGNRQNQFTDFGSAHSQRIDECITEFYRNRVQEAGSVLERELYSELGEYCTRPGKRVRPLLVLLSFHGYAPLYAKGRRVHDIAAAVEMMHSFLLIQDDVIDCSPLRRGGASLHVKMHERFAGGAFNESIGNDTALIMADVLFANALEIINAVSLGKTIKERFMQVFSMTYERTAFGQILDILYSLPRKIEPGSTVPRQIGELKTAYYTIYYPLLMGYVLTGRYSRREMERIRDFSLPLGLAFQIRDDILGVFGSEADIGKSADSDIREGKLTELVQSTADALTGTQRKEFVRRFTAKQKKRSDISYIRKMIVQSGALERAREKHAGLIEQSGSVLPALSLKKEYREILQGLIELVGEV